MSSGFSFSMQHPLLMPTSVSAQANSALSKAHLQVEVVGLPGHA
jgi:hypothetical protein